MGVIADHSEEITVGTSKTQEETNTNSWEVSVGAGLEGMFGASVGASMEQQFRTELTSTEEKKTTVSFENGAGYLWQWQITTTTESGAKTVTNTNSYALTKNLAQEPKCFPGYSIDGDKAYQDCESDFWLPGKSPQKNRRKRGKSKRGKSGRQGKGDKKRRR